MRGNLFAVLAAEQEETEPELEAEPEDAPVASAPPAATLAAPPDGEHPFDCDPGDHAETPLEAFAHVAPLLERLALRLGATPAALRLYDPFYCAGGSARHLGSLGFASVYNRNEDFYTAKKPEFDVLVTNPPFTRDHLPRAFAFAFACGRPFLLLAPQYCARKDWFLAAVAAAPRAARPAFLGPTGAPYVFSAPAALAAVRAKRGAAEEGDTIAVPAGKFQSCWFVSLGERHQKPVLDWWRRQERPGCALAERPEALPQLAAAQRPRPAERRWRRKRAREEEPPPATDGAAGDGDDVPH